MELRRMNCARDGLAYFEFDGDEWICPHCGESELARCAGKMPPDTIAEGALRRCWYPPQPGHGYCAFHLQVVKYRNPHYGKPRWRYTFPENA